MSDGPYLLIALLRFERALRGARPRALWQSGSPGPASLGTGVCALRPRAPQSLWGAHSGWVGPKTAGGVGLYRQS